MNSILNGIQVKGAFLDGQQIIDNEDAWKKLDSIQDDIKSDTNIFMSIKDNVATFTGYINIGGGSWSHGTATFGSYTPIAKLPDGISFKLASNDLGSGLIGIADEPLDSEVSYGMISFSLSGKASDNTIGYTLTQYKGQSWYSYAPTGAYESDPIAYINAKNIPLIQS